MNTEADLIERWRSERGMYREWGGFVRDKVLELLVRQLGEERGHVFLRLPAQPRTKTEASLVQKALYRKRYKNPYDDVEDKVGLRFVVLTSQEIPLVSQVLTGPGAEFWQAEKARDFVAERDANPGYFGYQSDHYILRANVGIVAGSGLAIKPDIPCEVQIRSILQHAYSEVTHDTIYKPSVKTTPEMLRAAAKAMALIEATDDYLQAVGRLIADSVSEVRDVVLEMRAAYRRYVGDEPAETLLDSQIVETFLPVLQGRSAAQIEAWLVTKPYIAERIVQNRSVGSIFELASILAVYYCVQHFPTATAQQDLIGSDELALIYSNLGIAMPY